MGWLGSGVDWHRLLWMDTCRDSPIVAWRRVCFYGGLCLIMGLVFCLDRRSEHAKSNDDDGSRREIRKVNFLIYNSQARTQLSELLDQSSITIPSHSDTSQKETIFISNSFISTMMHIH